VGRHNDKSIKEVLGDFIASNNKVAKGFYTAQIEEIWKTEMGPVIARYTSKVYFKDGVLKIYVTSAPLKRDLLMGKDKIIGIINDTLKKEIVTIVEIY
jgi:predicted nucleic acid-binding Zn ribbon protein